MQSLPRAMFLKRLLVYCYFCPDDPHRPGGVQQLVGPLLTALKGLGWKTRVVHAGSCHAKSCHALLPAESEIEEPNAVDPKILVERSRRMLLFADNRDVVLSIDRPLPCVLPAPCVLMSNTLAYQTEVAAVQSGQWDEIVTPTSFLADSIRAVNPTPRVDVVPYGLPEEFFREVTSAPSPVWGNSPSVVRLPHRPDRRKGHREAIEGLAHALPKSRHVMLEISWLNEARYSAFRRELEDLAHKLGVAGQVSFYNWVNGTRRWRSLSETCAVLQLGRFEETFGLSLVESILFGRPVVCRYQPALREIVGSSELLLEIQEPVEWYTALDYYWSHRNWTDSGTRHRNLLCQSLTLQRMAASYDQILTKTAQLS
jgi:glycosyltransferase involved in cell wall biosynthesis